MYCKGKFTIKTTLKIYVSIYLIGLLFIKYTLKKVVVKYFIDSKTLTKKKYFHSDLIITPILVAICNPMNNIIPFNKANIMNILLL